MDSHGDHAVCAVTGCGAPLSLDKNYCVKKRLCSAHMRADAVSLGAGSPLMRFCFQCGKLEPLAAFDGLKRTCRQRLLKRRACPGKRRCHHKSAGRHPAQEAAALAALEPISPVLPASSTWQAFSAPLPQLPLSGRMSCSGSGSDSNSGTAMGCDVPQLPYAAAAGASSCTLPVTSSYTDAAAGWAQLLPGFDAHAQGWGAPNRQPAPRRLSSTLQQAYAAPCIPAAAASPVAPAALTASISAPLPSCGGGLLLPTPSTDVHSELELVLASELTAAGLQAALSSCTEARLGSDASRELSWQLAAAVVENSLSLADSAASDLRQLQAGALAADSCGAAKLEASFSAWSSEAAAAAQQQQQQQQQLASCGLLLASGSMTSTSSATSGGSQVPVAERIDRLEHLRQHVAALQARMESLRAQIAMS